MYCPTYKLDKEVQGAKEFFKNNILALWTFRNYLDRTFLSRKEIKNVKHIYSTFKNDLTWLAKLDEVPNEIKNYILVTLIPQEHYTKKQLGLFLEAKKGKEVHKPLPVQNYTENNFHEGSTQNNYYGNLTSSKRNGSHNEAVSALSSPGKHNIVRCGHGVSPLPYLDSKLYKKHFDSHKVITFPLPAECIPYIDAVVERATMQAFEKTAKAIPDFEDVELQNATNFLGDLFGAMTRLYKSTQSSEGVFNHLLINRFLDAVALSFQAKHNCGSAFVPAEAFLAAVRKQLKALGNYKDDRYQYKADGIIKMAAFRDIELLLVETSGPFADTDKTKANFDHHKGTFGALVMLKTIADEFNNADLDVFSKNPLPALSL